MTDDEVREAVNEGIRRSGIEDALDNLEAKLRHLGVPMDGVLMDVRPTQERLVFRPDVPEVFRF